MHPEEKEPEDPGLDRSREFVESEIPSNDNVEVFVDGSPLYIDISKAERV